MFWSVIVIQTSSLSCSRSRRSCASGDTALSCPCSWHWPWSSTTARRSTSMSTMPQAVTPCPSPPPSYTNRRSTITRTSPTMSWTATWSSTSTATTSSSSCTCRRRAGRPSGSTWRATLTWARRASASRPTSDVPVTVLRVSTRYGSSAGCPQAGFVAFMRTGQSYRAVYQKQWIRRRGLKLGGGKVTWSAVHDPVSQSLFSMTDDKNQWQICW